MEQLTSAVYLDQRLDVEHYLEVIDHLSGEALTPADSLRFIEQAARKTRQERGGRVSRIRSG